MIWGPDTTSRFAGEMDRYADRLDEAAAAGDAAKMRPDEDTDEPIRRRQGAELGNGGALGGTRTPNLLIRSSMCGRPDRFRSVRDLGRVPARCSWPSGIPQGRSPRWLPVLVTSGRSCTYVTLPCPVPSPEPDSCRTW